MIFLNPAILIGLLAASVPILIHLLNLRQRRRVEFSSLMLLKQIQTSSLRRFKIREWALLAIRVLIIASLVVAFSKPVFPSFQAGSGFATQTKTSATLIVDVSPSMSYRDAFGNDVFRQAKSAALRALEHFSESDEIYVMFSNSLQEPTAQSASEAKKTLAQASVATFGVPLQTCVEKGASWLQRSTHLNREMYVISDFQRTGTLTDDSLNLAAQGINLFFIDVAPKRQENVGIEKVDVLTKVIEPQKPIRVMATARRTGESAKEVEARWNLDKKIAAQGAIQFDAQSVGEIALAASPTRTGFLSGDIELPKDNLELDNRHYLAFHIPEKMRVCLAYSDERECAFVKLALESFYEGKFFELTLAPESSLDSRSFATFDALILCGAKNLSATTIQKTVSFVEQGGGLILFAPINAQLNACNELLKRLGGGELKPLALSQPTAIDEVEVQHPIFEGMFSSKQKFQSQLSQAEGGIGTIFKTNDYLKSPVESRVLGYQTNKVFLATSRFANGAFVVCPTVPTQEAANFVLQPMFAPLLYRAIFTTALATQAKSETFIVGEEASFALPSSVSPSDELRVEKPSGKILVPTAQFRAGASRLFIAPALYDEVGVYRLFKTVGDESVTLAQFALNLSPKESALEKISFQELKEALLKAGIEEGRLAFADASEKADVVSEMISGSRYGLGVWKHLLVFVALLLLAESALGRKTEA